MKSKYNIKTKLVKDRPFITVEMSYKDSFSNDKYTLIGQLNEGRINFSFIKNKESKLNETSFYATNDFRKNTFINELSKRVNNYDFIEDFKKNNLEDFTKELSEFIVKCDSSMISNGKIFEGYKDKLKGMAGIKLINKNIR
tara:strand:- start:218 stop:640 length:423 start_codon:yes stop_codon:yes gene_type:complete